MFESIKARCVAALSAPAAAWQGSKAQKSWNFIKGATTGAWRVTKTTWNWSQPYATQRPWLNLLWHFIFLILTALLLTGAMALFVGFMVAGHPFFVKSWNTLPLWAVPALGVATGVIALRFRRGDNSWSGKTRLSLVAAVFSFLWASVYVTNTVIVVIENEMVSYLDVEKLSSFPVNDRNIRVLPESAAVDFAKESNGDDSRLEPGKAALVKVANGNGKVKIFWQVPSTFAHDTGTLDPFILLGIRTGAVGRIARIDAENIQKQQPEIFNTWLWFGQDSKAVDILLKVRHPFSERGESTYWRKADGSWVLLVSYISRTWTWLGTMVPVVAGVMEIGPHGWYHNYSREEAGKVFRGAALFPSPLARQYADVYAKYHDGLGNYFVEKKDIYEVSEDKSTEGQGSSFPFTQDMGSELGLQGLVPFEPNGKHTFALSEVLLFDSMTGKARCVRTTDQKLTGPRNGTKYVQSSDAKIDWSNLTIIRSSLVHSTRGDIDWLFVAVNKTTGAATLLVPVEATTHEARAFKHTEDMRKFLHGETPSPNQQQSSKADYPQVDAVRSTLMPR